MGDGVRLVILAWVLFAGMTVLIAQGQLLWPLWAAATVLGAWATATKVRMR